MSCTNSCKRLAGLEDRMDGGKHVPGMANDDASAGPVGAPSPQRFRHESREERIQVLRWQGFSDSEIAALTRTETKRGWMIMALGVLALTTGVVGFVCFKEAKGQDNDYVRLSLQRPQDNPLPYGWGRSDLTLEQGAPEEPLALVTPTQEVTPDPTPAPVRSRSITRSAPKQAPSPAAAVTEAPLAPPVAEPYRGPVPATVDRETQRALRSGKSQLWEENGDRGYVTVSGAVEYGSRVCRRVSYSKIQDGGQVTSAAEQWCREGRRGKWAPDPRTPE